MKIGGHYVRWKETEKIVDSKDTNVCQIAMATGISAATLYFIIQKDSNI